MEKHSRETCALLAAALVCGLLSASPTVARARTEVLIAPAWGPAGTQVTVRGSGFGKNRTATVRLGRVPVARARASGKGSFKAGFVMPDTGPRRLGILSSSKSRRVVSIFRRSRVAHGREIATAGGRRLRWSPSNAVAGDKVRVTGSGFPPNRSVRIRFGRAWVNAPSTGRRGRFTRRLTVPNLSTGSHPVRVKAGSESLRVSFKIAPDPVIVAAGDIACDPASRFFNGSYGTASDCHMRQTSNIALAAGPTAVLALGDTQYEDGALAKFQASYGPTWGRLKAITRPAIGNHEYETAGAAGYFDYFNGPGQFGGPAGDRDKAYYSFDVGTWHLVALNANCQLPQVGCATDSGQARWLRRDLRRNRGRCVLAYAGRPRFSSAHTGQYQPLVDMFKLLYDAGADVLLGGDIHNYERFASQTPTGQRSSRGVRQFVVGTGGKNISGFPGPILPTSEARVETFGALALTLHASSYGWRFLGEPAGRVLDSGRDGCR